MKRTVFAIFVLFAFVRAFSFAETLVFFYRDAVEVKTTVKTDVIFLPGSSYDIRVENNRIVRVDTTNLVPMKLLLELSNVTKEIGEIDGKLRKVIGEAERYKSLAEVLRTVLGAPYGKDAKTLSSLMDKFDELQERLYNIGLSISELEKMKAEKEEIRKKIEREISEVQEEVKVVKLSFAGGALYYKVSGKWETKYTLDTDKSILSFKVRFSLPRGFKVTSSKTVVTSMEIAPEIADIELRQLVGYVEEPVTLEFSLPKSKLTRLPEAQKDSYRLEGEQYEESVKERETGFGVMWEVVREITLEDGAEVTVLDSVPVEVSRKYYAIPSKYPTGFVSFKVSNISEVSFLPGQVDIVYLGNRVTGMFLETSVPKYGVFETKGISLKDLVVERKLVEERVETPKFLGTNRRIVRVFKNIIKNNLPTNITISILDRVPVPYDDRIRVGIEKITPSPETTYDAIRKDGVFMVTVSVEKGKKLENTVSYWIEHPANLRYFEYER